MGMSGEWWACTETWHVKVLTLAYFVFSSHTKTNRKCYHPKSCLSVYQYCIPINIWDISCVSQSSVAISFLSYFSTFTFGHQRPGHKPNPEKSYT